MPQLTAAEKRAVAESLAQRNAPFFAALAQSVVQGETALARLALAGGNVRSAHAELLKAADQLIKAKGDFDQLVWVLEYQAAHL